jgi:hypothetical protein
MKWYILLCLAYSMSACATGTQGVMQSATNSTPFDAAFVFVVAIDEIAGCPMNVARNLEIDRPDDACEQKGIPRYVAKIQNAGD